MIMTREQMHRRGPTFGGWLVVVLLGLLSIAPLLAADIELAVLRSGTDVFTNVTVYGQTATDLFIKHSRGFGNVKISSLDSATLRLLKPEAAGGSNEIRGVVSGKAAATMATLKAKLESSSSRKIPSEAELRALIARVQPSPQQLLGAAAGTLILYFIFCAGLKLICVNAGTKPGLMIWLPVLQMFPLLRAAKMSAGWFVLFLIPLVGVVAHIVWCIKITKACGKSKLVALLLILPVTNLLAFLYLALSSGDRKPAEAVMPIHARTAVLGEA